MSDQMGPARFVCFRCGMGFRIQPRSAKCSCARCPECLMRFWHGAHENSGKVMVGIDPSDHVPLPHGEVAP